MKHLKKQRVGVHNHQSFTGAGLAVRWGGGGMVQRVHGDREFRGREMLGRNEPEGLCQGKMYQFGSGTGVLSVGLCRL